MKKLKSLGTIPIFKKNIGKFLNNMPWQILFSGIFQLLLFGRGTMKKLSLCACLALVAAAVYAGDVAVFADLGFSEDGKTYLFGQYGKTDRDFEAWAEIYTVDVAQNDYVKNEVYRTPPSKDTEAISGKKAFEDLQAKTNWKTSRYNASPSSVQSLLYVRKDEHKNPSEEIVFKDFTQAGCDGVKYHVTLVPTFYGSGEDLRSSFYISMEQKNKAGDVISRQTVGSADIKRKCVSGYRINRIFTDNSKKSLVFLIEKTVQDEHGLSIRYMVETIRF